MGLEQTVDRAELTAAFAQFEQASSQLSGVYASLERRVGELSAALNASHARLEVELAEKERLATRLSALLAALPAGVVVLDAQGRVGTVNPGATELLGEIAPGDAWRDIVARAFAPRWDDGHDVSLIDGRRVNVSTQALADEPGQILMLQDVTETRRLQEQLSHHRRLSAKTEMAAALAHQIRTPLAAALLALGPVARARELTPAQARNARRALDAMRQLERLVENMLSFARGAVVDAQPIVVDALRRRLETEVRGLVDGSEFRVAFDGAPDARVVHGNADALISIMLNLVSNARQVTGGSGALLIASRRVGDFVSIRFIDNGPGVAAHDRERIFEPFFTTRGGGTGLGLSVAQAIARAHGGELAIDPDHTAGACFELTLPARAAASVASRTPIEALED
ncbi:MAG: PAS domain-containing sensor histidine kinase [Gammaproteobacteria bacterium]